MAERKNYNKNKCNNTKPINTIEYVYKYRYSNINILETTLKTMTENHSVSVY